MCVLGRDEKGSSILIHCLPLMQLLVFLVVGGETAVQSLVWVPHFGFQQRECGVCVCVSACVYEWIEWMDG